MMDALYPILFTLAGLAVVAFAIGFAAAWSPLDELDGR